MRNKGRAYGYILALLIVVGGLFGLTACINTECDHQWIDATCTQPKTCELCHATEGEALGHQGESTDCTKPAVCNICGASFGETAEHDWVGGSCTEARHCSKCDAVDTEVLGHLYGEWTAEIPATCETKGTHGYYSCSVCDKKFDADKKVLTSLEIPAIGHTYGKWIEETSATCKEEGIVGHFHCSVCSKDFDANKNVLTSITLPVADHAYGEWIEEDPATCKEEGTVGHFHCSVCSKDFDANKNILTSITLPVADHAYGEWIEEDPSTCKEEGTVGHFHCSVCSKDFDANKNILTSITLPIADHAYGEWIEEAPATCKEEGTVGHFHCSVCSKNFDANKNVLTSIILPVADHAYGEWIEEAPANCEEDGSVGHFHCSVCSKDFDADKNVLTSVVIPALGHAYAYTPLGDGTHTVSCENGCGASYIANCTGGEATCTAKAECEFCKEEYGDEPQHQWEESGETPATCTADGVRNYTCDACGETKSEGIPSLGGHRYENEGAVVVTPPTCVENGYTTYSCDNCDESHIADEVAAAGEHTWDKTEVTCTEGRSCTVDGCGATGEALGHDHNVVDTKLATCTEAAMNHYQCSRCEDNYWESVGSANGHSTKTEKCPDDDPSNDCGFIQRTYCEHGDYEVFGDVEWEHSYVAAITTPATCTTDGEKTLTCSKCGDVRTEVIEKNATGHAWVNGEEQDGKRVDTCSNEGCDATKTVTVFKDTTQTDSTNANDLKDTEIELNDTNISLDSGVIDAIGDKNVTVSADKFEGEERDDLGLLPEQLQQIGNSPIYNFTISDGESNISQFGENNFVTITLPYTLEEGEDVDAIYVWFISDAGAVEAIKATYNEVNGQGYVTFQTNHFSYYTVTKLTPKQRCEKYGHPDGGKILANVAASCLTDGYVEKFCPRCHETWRENEVKAPGQHNYLEVTTEATCTTEGCTTFTCQNEGCNFSYTVRISATGHDYVEIDRRDATCEAAGFVKYLCANGCEAEHTDLIPQLTHDVKSEVIAPTCEAYGYTHYWCDNCTYSYTDTMVAPIGHSYVLTWSWSEDFSQATAMLVCENDASHVISKNASIKTKVTNATCSTEGSIVYTATAVINGETYTDTKTEIIPVVEHEDGFRWMYSHNEHWKKCDCGNRIDVEDHSFDIVTVIKPATCQEEGEQILSCVCGATRRASIPAGNHSITEWNVTVDPTCEEQGEERGECQYCDYYEIRQVEALGHTCDHWNDEIPATCEQEGTLGYFNCSVCGKNYDADNNELSDLVIPALGHTYGEWNYEMPASCEGSGILGHYHCAVCEKDFDADMNELESLDIPALGHTYGEWIEEVPADCDEDGTLGHYHCPACGNDYDANRKLLKTLVIPSTGEHIYENGVCTGCGKSETDCDHNFANVSVTTNDGVTVITTTCTACETVKSVEMKIFEAVLEYHDGSYYYDFTVIPETDGNYTIQGLANRDTYVTLYSLVDGEMIDLAYNDDGAENLQFKLSYYLIAGETYIFRVRFYSSSEGGNIPFMFSNDAAGESECMHGDGKPVHFGILADGATSCEGGVTYGTLYPSCGCVTNVRFGKGHDQFITTNYELSELGFCGGYVNINECACGYSKYMNWSPNCPHSMEYPSYTDDNGIYHDVQVYTCMSDCGSVVTRDGYWLEEGCYNNYYITYTFTVNGETVLEYTYVSDRNEHHDCRYEYELQGESCEDGVLVKQLCKNCNYERSYTINYHESHTTTIQLSDYGFCGGYVNISECACGYSKRMDCYFGCGYSCDYSYITDENGISHEICTYTCSTCNAVWTRDRYTLKENCFNNEYVAWTFTINGETVLEYCYISSRYTAHDYRYEYELQGESCEDGVSVKQTCADCGYESLWSTHYHSDTYGNPQRVEGFCNGGYLEFRGCACGKEGYVNNYAHGCSWNEESERYTDEDGVSHIVWTYECTECGMKWVQDQAKIKDTECRGVYNYTDTVYAGDELIAAHSYFNGTWEEHDHTYNFTLTDGVSCDNGYTLEVGCTRCDYTNTYSGYGHRRYQIEHHDLTEFGFCGGYAYLETCACGYSQTVGWSFGDGYSSSYDSFTDESGIYHDVRTYTCVCGCGATMVRDRYTIKEGCVNNQYYKYTFAFNGETVLEYCYINSRSSAHDYRYEYELQGESCEDGVLIKQTCADCDYLSEWTTNYHGDTYSAHRVEGFCNDGYVEFRICACGQEGYDNSRINCSWDESSSERYTDADGVSHIISTMECTECGMKVIADLAKLNKTACSGVYRHTYAVYSGDEQIAEYSFFNGTWEEHDLIHNFTLSDGVSCDGEGGYSVTITCSRCEYFREESGYGHVQYDVEYYDLATLGACHGYIRLYSCACGHSTYLDRGFCYSKSNRNTYLDENGVLHYVEVRECETCGLRYQDDYYSVRDASICQQITYHSVSVFVGETGVRFNYESRAESHDYVYTGELMEGATDCNGGVIVTHTCRDCGESYSNHYYHHYTVELNRIDLSQYGSLCGGYAVEQGCPCGYYHGVSLDALCDLGHSSTLNWIDGALSSYHHDGEFYWDYSIDAGIYTCAVTDPERCAFKIRYAKYALQDENACTTTRYETWQFGYNEETGECLYELTFKTGSKGIYHDFTQTEIAEDFEDGSYVRGWRYDCDDCGSYYHWKDFYNADGDYVRSERVWDNKTDVGNKYREEIREYRHYTYTDRDGNEHRTQCTVREYNTYISQDGTESWDEYLYEYNYDYEIPFGDYGYECVRTHTNSGGYSEVYKYANVSYRNYTFEIYAEYQYPNDNNYWYRHDYAYSFENGCKRVPTYTDSNGANEVREEQECHPNWHYVTIQAPTCTQDGMRGHQCPICEMTYDEYKVNPNGHNWYRLTDGLYICRTCGMKNVNGADGSVVIEDLTEEYGNGEYFVAGYWDQTNVTFMHYLVLKLHTPMENGDDEVYLDGIEVVELENVRALAFSRAEVISAAEALGYTADQYDVQLVFVPYGADGSFDYSIIFTEDEEDFDPNVAITDTTHFVAIVEQGERYTVELKPEAAGTWLFVSNSEPDPVVEIYRVTEDGDRIRVGYDDDGGNGNNFQLEISLEAGATYELVVRWFSNNYFGQIPVYVFFTPTETSNVA